MDPLNNNSQQNTNGAASAMPVMPPAVDSNAPAPVAPTTANMPVMNPAMAAAPVVEPTPTAPAMPDFSVPAVGGSDAPAAAATSASVSAATPADPSASTTLGAPTFSAPDMPVANDTLTLPEMPRMGAADAAAKAEPALPEMPMPGADLAGVGGYSAAEMGLPGTTPLTRPELPKAPDPVEEELKMPLRPAEPVPGSIGSAVSGPATQTPSVAFNDPAMVNEMAQTNLPAAAQKKSGKLTGGKMNRTTLILLCVVGGLIIVALVAILVMQMNGLI